MTAHRYPDLSDGEPCGFCGHATALPGQAPPPRKAVFNADARKTVQNEINALVPELTEISHYIHENPEIMYKEFKAHTKLTNYLTEKGLEVQQYEDIPTAFRVEYTHGNGGRVFGFNSEYDALPAIGHACGHNLIAVAGVAAFLGVRQAMIEQDIPGKVVLLGTPAEEGGAGKVKLINAGAYKDIGACMMIHPGRGPAKYGGVGPSLAVQRIFVEYFGKSSHAAAAPWEGVNALDAATIAYASVSGLTSRVHGVITEGGGTAANVIPAYTLLSYAVRGPSAKDVDTVREKMIGCFEGAAKSTGCTVKVRAETMVTELRNDKPLADEYASTMSDLFRIPVTVGYDQAANIGASTDFGNVTHELPSCHPMYGIPTPDGRANHTPEFTAIAKGEIAHEETFKGSIAMACVGLRFLGDPEFAEKVTKYWKEDMGKAA
ncbi:hypothetical protein CI109_102739 [Kwoniella shandongensis]|uniref:Peptidase M20 domain-containing protein 2 n=1 Tax=Kwoniella shandongensis TaxID=1734106 RepID=A0AAJ8LI66_9TREE